MLFKVSVWQSLNAKAISTNSQLLYSMSFSLKTKKGRQKQEGGRKKAEGQKRQREKATDEKKPAFYMLLFLFLFWFVSCSCSYSYSCSRSDSFSVLSLLLPFTFLSPTVHFFLLRFVAFLVLLLFSFTRCVGRHLDFLRELLSRTETVFVAVLDFLG